ncbi:hypothetical protein [Microbacterium rhizomatis]|uniref:Uncharacterized protein n=1 Tax=Microbacterium rhizomatis TaxID=1631477 RepID=A0A5J5IWZ4_9MICO|nr:hypothetical protein [Microbacterium rhizomatis]KAA9105015.1 hypothetical protein F6B43_18375 [Microbacterium rhizomatis]
MSITRPCIIALSDLVHSGRDIARAADSIGYTRLATAAAECAATLDGARTRLVEDGPDYLDAAWAFLDAGRRMTADHARLLDRALMERLHA